MNLNRRRIASCVFSCSWCRVVGGTSVYEYSLCQVVSFCNVEKNISAEWLIFFILQM